MSSFTYSKNESPKLSIVIIALFDHTSASITPAAANGSIFFENNKNQLF